MIKNFEDAILSAFIFASTNNPDLEEENRFNLDKNIFSTPLKKRLAEVINDTEMYLIEFKCLTLDELISTTKFEHEYAEILSQTPLPLSVAKKYYEFLVTKKRKELIL